jgi:hypothetical protein
MVDRAILHAALELFIEPRKSAVGVLRGEVVPKAMGLLKTMPGSTATRSFPDMKHTPPVFRGAIGSLGLAKSPLSQRRGKRTCNAI